jgi:hypothetical protein
MVAAIPRATSARVFATTSLLLAAAAIYEIAVALRVIPLGNGPGEGPVGAGIVVPIALLALLVGMVASSIYAFGRSVEWRSAASLVAPAAAAFVLARFYSFNPYFAPNLRRMSDGGFVAGRCIVALVVIALLAGLATKILPRFGIAMTSVALLLSALTAVAEGID